MTVTAEAIPARTASTTPAQYRDFAPITLGELKTQAGLLSRIDRKYMVDTVTTFRMLGELARCGARILEIDGQRTFRYLSDYYDTADFALHNLAATKRRRRYKVRERIYVDSGLHFMEVKTRGGRGKNVKSRYAMHDVGVVARQAMWEGESTYTPVLAGSTAGEWAVGALERAGVVEAGEGATAIERLTPCLRTAYTRTTLLLPEGSRLTLDVGLRTQALREGGVSAHAPFVVVETKSGGKASMADRILWNNGVRPRKISKYGIGVAIAYGERANKWARTLPFMVQE